MAGDESVPLHTAGELTGHGGMSIVETDAQGWGQAQEKNTRERESGVRSSAVLDPADHGCGLRGVRRRHGLGEVRLLDPVNVGA